MRTVLFHDDGSRSAAAALARRRGDAVTVPMVQREHELRVLREVPLTAEDIAEVAAQSRQITSELRELLPTELVESGDSQAVSFWDAYAEFFRSWAVAPLLANRTLARRALQMHKADAALALENPRTAGWWSYRQQVAEALGTALDGVPLQASPGASLRLLRDLVSPSLIAWPTGLLRLRADARISHGFPSPSHGPEPCDVLFLAIGGTSVPLIDRLASPLRDQHDLHTAALLLAAEDAGMEKRSTADVPYYYLGGFHPAAPTVAGQVLTHWRSWYRHAAPLGAARYGELWRGLRGRLLVALARDAQQVLADIVAADRLLDHLQPRALVALHLYWHRLAPVVLAARKRGLPVLYLQHGVYLAKDDCIRPLPYDEYMVFGQSAVEALQGRACGGPVVPVGHCLYDEVVTGGLTQRAGRRPGRVVLLATQPDEKQVYDVASAQWWVRGVALACREIHATLQIKLHPRDLHTDMYEALAQELPDTVTLLSAASCTMAEGLTKCDVLVTRDSTVVFEANLMQVPVLTVNLTERDDRFPFAADGGAVGVYSYGDILPALQKVLDDGGRQLEQTRPAFLSRHTGAADGQATQRVVDTLLRHLSQTASTA